MKPMNLRLRKVLVAALMIAPVPFAAYGVVLDDGLPLRAEIRVAKTDVFIGEPVVLDVYLVNDGTATVTVPSRPDMIPMQVRIEDAAGQVRELRVAPANMLGKWVIEPMTLEPGMAIVRRVLLDEHPESAGFAIEEAGNYAVSVLVGPGYESDSAPVWVALAQGEDAAAVRALRELRVRLDALPLDTPAQSLAWHETRNRENREFIAAFGSTVLGDFRRIDLAQSLMTEFDADQSPEFAEAAGWLGQILEHDSAFPLRDQAVERLIVCNRKLGRVNQANLLRTQLLLHLDSPAMFEMTKQPIRLLSAKPQQSRAMDLNRPQADDPTVKRFTE